LGQFAEGSPAHDDLSHQQAPRACYETRPAAGLGAPASPGARLISP